MKIHGRGPTLGVTFGVVAIIFIVMYFACNENIIVGQEQVDYWTLWASLIVGGVGGLILAVAFDVLTRFYSTHLWDLKEWCLDGTVWAHESEGEKAERLIFTGRMLEGEAGAPYREFLGGTLGNFSFEDSQEREKILLLQKQKIKEANRKSKRYYFLWKCILFGGFVVAPLFAFCGTAFAACMLALNGVYGLGACWLIPLVAAILGIALMVVRAYMCDWYNK